MIPVPPSVLKHVLAACEGERDRLESVRKSLGGDEDPPGFDANDIPLYDVLIASINTALREARGVLDFHGRSLVFVLYPIAAYVRANRLQISTEAYEALRDLYSLLPPSSSFDEYPN